MYLSRPNIFLEFKSEKAMKIEDNLQWLVQELKEGLENTPKTIVYCRYSRNGITEYI